MTIFQPYPMRLTAPDGTRVRVMNQADHDRLLEEWTSPAEPEPPPAPATPPANPLLTGDVKPVDADPEPLAATPSDEPEV